MSLSKKIFNICNAKRLKHINTIVKKIEKLRSTMISLNNNELYNKTKEYRKRLKKDETLDDLLPEAFATVREASRRVLNIEHYRVQLMGGIVLHQGDIIEMQTGEGKTLVSTLSAYLNALKGYGVHIVTVNDYLALRDAKLMSKIYNFLGLTVGVVISSVNINLRYKQYLCDITYVTNSELGFDYLRDNMVFNKNQIVQRKLYYAIIDEVDSILIDEARTPLIISGDNNKSIDIYKYCNILSKKLKRGRVKEKITKIKSIIGEKSIETGDYIINEKDKIIYLTEHGINKVERFFNIKNLADIKNIKIQYNVILALRANYFMIRDKDYIVKNGKILIIDEFTGRIMYEHRYSNGLHQAIEAKENVSIKNETKIFAIITFQSLFNKYKKKSGMTGTAVTEQKEFYNIYKMNVVVIPSNKPIIRVDNDDIVYITKKNKFNAIIKEIKKSYLKKQPVLVGTNTIKNSEIISCMLSKLNIKHNVLNAKLHKIESEIIRHAGEPGIITIATNMAGRGTDIKLNNISKKIGGLKVIGVERNESRRIDNQLRGRSGRQGDPGESYFFISLEDDLMRLFCPKKLISIFKSVENIMDNKQIKHKLLSNTIKKAQEKIENNNYEIRKNLFEYDIINNKQCEIIYKERKHILYSKNIKKIIYNMIYNVIDNIIDNHISSKLDYKKCDINNLLNNMLFKIIPLNFILINKFNLNELKQYLKDKSIKLYKKNILKFQKIYKFCEIERIIMLIIIDKQWSEHIENIEQLKQSIWLQAYAQRNPKIEYKIQTYKMFNIMMYNIQKDIVYFLYHFSIEF